MSTVLIGILIILVILMIGYAADFRRIRTAGYHRWDPKHQVKVQIIDRPGYDDVLPFDGLPNGEIYDNVEGTASAKQCAQLCVDDTKCDSWTYLTMDGVCQKRQNTQNAQSNVYWIKGHKAMKVPGRELKADMLREQTVNNGDECAKVCMSDSTCSVADFNETSKMCRLGSVISTHNAANGIIPSRRTAVDLASTS